MCGRSTTADTTAASVKERDPHIAARASGNDGFLCFVEFPSSRQTADILCRVRVSEHHFLTALNPRSVPGEFEQRVENLRGVLQIVCCLEERHGPQRRGDASLFLQQLHLSLIHISE